jgi:hypothetical protein
VENSTGENSGLCSTCVHAATCMYVGDAEHPVMNCEEFSHVGPSVTRPPRTAAADAPAGEHLDEEFERFLTEGLCATCASRDTCTLPRPPAGVWRCDAYRAGV